MGSTSYFGRAEDGRRRLGSDFDLLAKWSLAFPLRPPVHSFFLKQLSAKDRATLFSAPASQDFRLEVDLDHTVKLVPITDGARSEAPGQIDLRNIDRDVLKMIHSDNYARSEKRLYELCCEVEDAQNEAQAASARELARLILQGVDGETAEKLAKKAADNVLDAAARGAWNRRRVAKLKNLAKTLFMPKVEGITLDATRVTEPESGETSNSRSADNFDRETTPQAKPTVKAGSPQAVTPEYGSETTADSVHWSSPRDSVDDFTSSPELESVTGFSDGADGGVALLPTSLLHVLGLNDDASTVRTPDSAAPSARFCSHGPEGHLGTGLVAQAFSAGYKGPLSNPERAVDTAFNAVDSAAVADPFVTPKKTGLDASVQPFTPSPNTHQHPVAKEQPWMGFICYDINFQLRADCLVPKYWTTKRGKERYIRHKIGELKLDDARLRSDRVLGAVARNPVHIFVDLSNIIIGFYDSMKDSRGIPVQKRVMAPPFSFKNFDTVLTRDRNVAKRIIAGSLSNSHNRRWPEYMTQAQELNYEMNILQRVPKPASPPRRRKSKSGSRESESAASGPDVSGDDCQLAPMKHGEQGVDELLHLKILQSALDTPNPATMVLATGDAAHAQYSDGFKKNIERVLALGWNIELYGWSRNISSAWREPEFAEKWGHQFKIIELDEFCEELFDMTIESMEL